MTLKQYCDYHFQTESLNLRAKTTFRSYCIWVNSTQYNFSLQPVQLNISSLVVVIHPVLLLQIVTILPQHEGALYTRVQPLIIYRVHLYIGVHYLNLLFFTETLELLYKLPGTLPLVVE